MASRERFALCGQHMDVNRDRTMITSVSSRVRNTAFGSLLIRPSLNSNHFWKFKIHPTSNVTTQNYAVFVGLCCADHEVTLANQSLCNQPLTCYLYTSSGQKYCSMKSRSQGTLQPFSQNTNCGPYRYHDIVCMNVRFLAPQTTNPNYVAGVLSFCKMRGGDGNGSASKIERHPFQCAYNIGMDIVYKMAVSLQNAGVELIEYVHQTVAHVSPKCIANTAKNKRSYTQSVSTDQQHNDECVEPPRKKQNIRSSNSPKSSDTIGVDTDGTCLTEPDSMDDGDIINGIHRITRQNKVLRKRCQEYKKTMDAYTLTIAELKKQNKKYRETFAALANFMKPK